LVFWRCRSGRSRGAVLEANARHIRALTEIVTTLALEIERIKQRLDAGSSAAAKLS
jgi:hypothetical protein